MKRYRTYTAKKYKLARRIIFYAVIAVIIFALTLLLGNHLKSKLETADTKEPLDLSTTVPEKENDKDAGEESVPHDEALGAVNSGYISLLGVTEETEAVARVEAVKAQGFNGISYLITDGTGKLTYQSPSVEEESRLPADGTLVSYEILERAVTRARNLGMTVTAVMSASESLTDELVAAELGTLGFDEVIVRGFEGYTVLDGEKCNEIVKYAKRIRLASEGKLSVSICFAPEFFKAPKNAPYIEKEIFPNAEFLSIDMTNVSAADATALAGELGGSFTRYLLRPVLSGDNKESAGEVSRALTDAGIEARQYISAVAETVDSDTSED